MTVLGQGPLPAQGVLDPDPAVSGHLYSGKAGGVRRWGAKEGAGVSPRGSSSPLPGFPANTASGNRARDPPASAASCRPRAPPAPPRLPAQAQPPEKGVGGGTERSWGLEPRACSRTSSASAPSRRRLAPAVGFVGGGPLQPPHPRTLRGQHARWTQEPHEQGTHLLFTNRSCSKLSSTRLYKGSDDPRKSTTVGKKEAVATGRSCSC